MQVLAKIHLACLVPRQDAMEILAEFAVCMVAAWKTKNHIERELAVFLGDQAKPFTDWFAAKVRAITRA